jgi:hypothetical protein
MEELSPYATRSSLRAEKAKKIKNDGADPRPERTRKLQDGDAVEGLTVAGLLDRFVTRYIKKDAGLRSGPLMEATLNRLVKPRIGKKPFHGSDRLRRSDVVAMLDEIADENGPVMADRTLAYVRKAFNWHAARDDEFQPPIVRGMARTKPKDRKRKRILANDEIRDLWGGRARNNHRTSVLRAIREVAAPLRDPAQRVGNDALR